MKCSLGISNFLEEISNLSQVRGSGRECQAGTAQERPRKATWRLRSGGGGQEELPCVQGQGRRLEELPRIRGQGRRREELPHIRGQGRRPGGATPCPKPEARGGVRGQGRRPGGPTPRPRSSDCAGAGGPRGAIPR